MKFPVTEFSITELSFNNQLKDTVNCICCPILQTYVNSYYPVCVFLQLGHAEFVHV